MQSLPRTLPLLRRSLHRQHQIFSRPLQIRCLATVPSPPGKNNGEEPFKEIDSGLKDKDKDATPPRLSRPIGLSHPPRQGENTGIDPRTWAERRDDFTNWDKHLAKREKMTKEIFKPYFRDFSNLSAKYKGKSFLSPPLLFRSDKSLFFPNLVGRTLQYPSDPLQNTTDVLEGKVSVVAVFSSAWAEAQVRTFTDGLVLEGEDVQRVDVNVEQNPLKAWLVRAFVPSIRSKLPVGQHGRYFLVDRGLEEEMRMQMGYVNSKVGYVYLLDWNCKIRWAGSGKAGEEEKIALRRGIEKLKDDWKKLEAEREARREEREKMEMEKKAKVADEDGDF